MNIANIIPFAFSNDASSNANDFEFDFAMCHGSCLC